MTRVAGAGAAADMPVHGHRAMPPSYATSPVMRVHGPLNMLLDVHGETIVHGDRLHPHFGQGKRIVPWLDYGAEW